MVMVLKGLGLGTLMLSVFTFVYFWANGMFGSGGAVAGGVARELTCGSVLYRIAAALFLALGVVIVLMWPVNVSG
jgi:hypothetical protein